MASSGAVNFAGAMGQTKAPSGAVVVVNSARQAAAANVAAVATLPGVANKTTYLMGMSLVVGTAAAAASLVATLAGVLGGTWTMDLDTATASPLSIGRDYSTPVPASAPNTALVATIPASGAAGPPIWVVLVGFQL
jgi:hypothetical protein